MNDSHDRIDEYGDDREMVWRQYGDGTELWYDVICKIHSFSRRWYRDGTELWYDMICNRHLFLQFFYWYILGPYARTKEGEVWVWQFREQRENLPSFDSDEDNSQDDLLVIIFVTSGNLQYLGRAPI